MMLQKCGETLQNKLSCGNFQEGKFQIKHKKGLCLLFRAEPQMRRPKDIAIRVQLKPDLQTVSISICRYI